MSGEQVFRSKMSYEIKVWMYHLKIFDIVQFASEVKDEVEDEDEDVKMDVLLSEYNLSSVRK
jgi:hypothetical protein